MIENNEVTKQIKEDYRNMVALMGKKEFTLLKMQEFGFWPPNLPTPYERQTDETPEQYEARQKLTKKYQKVVDQIAKLYGEKDIIAKKLRELQKQYDSTWDYDKIRQDVAKKIMQESIVRRKERKKQREIAKQKRTEAWKIKKAENIVFIGRGYSALLNDKQVTKEKLIEKGLPVITDDHELADFLSIEYKTLRQLTYHRDVLTTDNYHHYKIPKKKGGMRSIAAPKPLLKEVQQRILREILAKVNCSESSHGFLIGKSIITSAFSHTLQPELLINIDIEDFFPTITFKRVLGMFKSFGYSGYISSLLAMLCTYCERIAIEIKGKIKYVKTTDRILPQGSPASPMITNIICRKLDRRLNGLANKFGYKYTRYADDMSFSIAHSPDGNEGKFYGLVVKILHDEGFKVNIMKTRFLRKNNRQAVTGIVLNNSEIGVSKKWLKNFRATIHNSRKLKASGELSEKAKHEISGMMSWLKSVNAPKYNNIILKAQEVIDNNGMIHSK